MKIIVARLPLMIDLVKRNENVFGREEQKGLDVEMALMLDQNSTLLSFATCQFSHRQTINF